MFLYVSRDADIRAKLEAKQEADDEFSLVYQTLDYSFWHKPHGATHASQYQSINIHDSVLFPACWQQMVAL